MIIRHNTIVIKLIFLAFVLLAGGCTKSFNIKPVSAPQNAYSMAVNPETSSLGLIDARISAAKPLNIGTLAVELPGMGDEIDYLGENLARVLNAEGIKVAKTARFQFGRLMRWSALVTRYPLKWL
jgi:hypothetical protein